MHEQAAQELFEQYLPVGSSAAIEIETEQNFMRTRLRDGASTFIGLIDNDTQALVGFTYAYPRDTMPDDYEIVSKGLTDDQYDQMQERTAEIGWTVISPSHQRKHGLIPMMTRLEKELVESGRFDEATTSAVPKVAEIIRARYGPEGAIVRQIQKDGDYGPQTFFRIKLPQPDQPRQ